MRRSTNEVKDRMKLVQSRYSEETLTHLAPLNIEADGRNRPVATQTTISKSVTFSDTSPVTQNSDVIIHTIVRGKAPIISNLFTYNKHNFTAEILENVSISGLKDSAIHNRGDVKDSSLVPCPKQGEIDILEKPCDR